MHERREVPFVFLNDLLDRADESSEPAQDRPLDEELMGSKAAVLDATANVIGALRQLLQATEDMVRLRRERLTQKPPPPPPRAEHHGRERVDISY